MFKSKATSSLLCFRNSYGIRAYSIQPPRKSYISIKNPLQLWWFNKVPLSVKYFAVIGATAFTLTHVHHNVLITVGPPVAVGGYFAYKWYKRHQFKLETAKVFREDLDKVRIAKYDETDISNVVKGIDTQFDHFKRNIVDVLEQKILEYVVKEKTLEKSSSLLDLLMKEDQITLNINENEIESFVILKIPPPHSRNDAEVYDSDLVEFIKLSLPFYSSKDVSARKRQGVIEVSLLQSPIENANYLEYKIYIEIFLYKLWFPKPIVIDGNGTITNSKMLDVNSSK